MPQLTPAQFQRAEKAYFAALQMSPAQRASYVDSSCGDDPAVAEEVRALLTVAATQSPPSLGPLGSRAAEALAAGSHDAALSPSALAPDDVGNWVGRQIGPYRITQILGQGGMGVVFRAEQEQPVRRTVAIKLIRPGMDSEDVIARFESERQALALMNHASVARVFDAGTTDTGRHFFVMEYVDGSPITKFCDENKLSLRQRLDLFMLVCEAVNHAHHKGIIHRDLKASNVLVARDDTDGAPLPKVIDFGIAKAVGKALAGSGGAMQTMHTQHDAPIGTPEYMSPEQASSAGATSPGVTVTARASDVDSRTDVYSLGVLLYELITGDLPFERERLRQTAIDEMWRIIREEDPPQPSARLSSLMADASTAIARQRGAGDPTTLARHVKGDLDWITMKALEKDRERRYDSPAALSADIRRYIDHEPVTAGPPSAAYRARKFVRRNRALVGGCVAVGVALIAGAVVAGVLAVRARRAEQATRVEQARTLVQKELAERRFEDVRKLAGTFIFDIDTVMTQQGTTAARELMVKTALLYLDRLSQEATGDRRLARDIIRGYERVARVQYAPGLPSLNNPAGSLESSRKALALAEQLAGKHPDSKLYRADVYLLWTVVAEASSAAEGPERAIECLERTIELTDRELTTDPNDLRAKRAQSIAIDKVGHAYARMHRFADAMEWHQRALKLNEQLAAAAPTTAPATGRDYRRGLAQSHVIIGRMLMEQGKSKEALSHCETYRDMIAVLAAEEPQTVAYKRELAKGHYHVAEAQTQLMRFDEAIVSHGKALEFREWMVKQDPTNALAWQDVGFSRMLRGTLQRRLGRTADAIADFDASRAAFDRLASMPAAAAQSAIQLANAELYLAEELITAGRVDEAESAARRAGALVVARRDDPAAFIAETPDGLMARVERVLGLCALMPAQAGADAAVAHLDRAMAGHRSLAASRPANAIEYADRLRTADDLVRAQLAAGRTRDAEITARVNLNEAEKRLAADPDDVDRQTFEPVARARLAVALIRSSPPQLDEAESLLVAALRTIEAVALKRTQLVATRQAWAEVHSAMAELWIARRRADDAVSHLGSAIQLTERIVADDPSQATAARQLAGLRARLRPLTPDRGVPSQPGR